MCRGNVDAGVPSAPHPPTYPPQPCIFHCSLLFSFLLIRGLVATDLGSETNGFWFLGQEILPSTVGEQEVYGTALGLSWLEGAGVCGGAFLLCLALVHFRKRHLPPQDPASPSLSRLQLARMVIWDCHVLLIWTSFLQMNSLSDAYVKHWHSLTRSLPRNVSSGLGHAAAD